jgi:quercetin dioxygenase-like cupin family protein
MALRPKVFSLGKLTGTIFDFETEGDVLAMHTHTEDDVHITVVARGSFRAHGNGWERIVKSGDVIDFPPHQQHEFVALEDKSRIVNIVKG